MEGRSPWRLVPGNMQLKLVVSLLPLSSAYVILPGMHNYNEPAFAIRWNSPTKRDTWPKSSLDDGLAGGLTFAYSPSFDAFCNGIMGQMKENTPTIKWANCEEIENAVMRAMATWEANHQAIKFVDVTQACARETMSQDMTKCSLAEIVITSGAPDSSASTVAALVTHHSEAWGYPTTLGPSSTAGMRATKDYTIEKVRHRKTTLGQRVSIDNNPASTVRAHASRRRLCTSTTIFAGTSTTRSVAACTRRKRWDLTSGSFLEWYASAFG